MDSSTTERGLIDLRSDTVTRPGPEMREAMASAPVGDDVYGEDPTVFELESRVAGLFGKERGLFVPTGVMANQLALRVQTNPGDEVIVGEWSHIFHYESAAPSVLSGIQLHTVPDPEGRMELEDIDFAVRENVYYMPHTAVIAQENSHNRTSGRIVSIEHLTSVFDFARERDIAVHLDGARIWNASVASGTGLEEYGGVCDTLSVCLSKGLGAPVGSVFLGTDRQIDQAWRFRKMWGGGWRQAGILAAAGLWALDHTLPKLAADHSKARTFHSIISASPEVDAGSPPETNIVVFRLPSGQITSLVEHCRGEGILLSAAFRGALRAVFHHDVSIEEAERGGRCILEWRPE